MPPGDHTEYPSLASFLNGEQYAPGTLTINHRGLPIDVYYDPRDYPATTVFFNAAITNPKLSYPFFSGAGISEDLPTNRIHIHDPSLYMDARLKLAWYAGSRRQSDLQSAISQVLRALVSDDHRIVTSGSSGGGFAAMYYATKFRHATAVPVNPQTNVARYNPQIVARYAELAWGVTGSDPTARIPAELDLGEVYSQRVPNRTWYVQNTGDIGHLAGHMRPFLDVVHEDNDVETILVDAGSGHVPPPKSLIIEVLAAAVRGADRPPQK